MKTPKIEGVHPLASETAEEVAERLPVFIDKYNTDASTRYGAVSARSRSRSGTLGRRSNMQPEPARPQAGYSRLPRPSRGMATSLGSASSFFSFSRFTTLPFLGMVSRRWYAAQT